MAPTSATRTIQDGDRLIPIRSWAGPPGATAALSGERQPGRDRVEVNRLRS
jgi:hypothetical protein